AAHTHAIFDHLASHFSDPELSLTKVAQDTRISARYLQRLLKTQGTSFTEHVTDLRLNHAFALLTAQGNSDIHICDVALQAGFSDASYFNRLFRSRFGGTPSDVRAQSRVQSRQKSSTTRTIPDLSRANDHERSANGRNSTASSRE